MAIAALATDPPYGDTRVIPSQAKVRAFPVVERNHMIWAWHHGNEGPPFYEIGSFVMANSNGPTTNGSQFFIVTGQKGVDLPADYTLFGKVTEGMEVVKEIEATGSPDGTPAEPTTITSVTITEE